jgi:hypothetical protein
VRRLFAEIMIIMPSVANSTSVKNSPRMSPRDAMYGREYASMVITDA